VATLILQDVEFHEDSYKVRLMLGLLELGYQRRGADGDEMPEASPAPNDIDADLPCLRDGDLAVRGAEAILAYLARRYDWRDRWLPADEPVLFGETLTWLSFASRRLRAVGLVDAIFGIAPDDPEDMMAARAAFRVLEAHLRARRPEGGGGTWFVGRTPTVADVAIFPAVEMSTAAGLDLAPYPALCGWMRAMRVLPGFVPPPALPGVADEGRLAPPRRLSRPVRGGNVIILPKLTRHPANSVA
jgi:glutathione S-transferase